MLAAGPHPRMRKWCEINQTQRVADALFHDARFTASPRCLRQIRAARVAPPPSRRMADGFDIVPVGVEHEGAVVVRVVMRARPGWTVVAAAGGQRRAVELVHLL